MPQKIFKLTAKVNSHNPKAVGSVLQRIIETNGKIRSVEGGFEVEAKLKGESAKDLNRTLLSEMRRAEKRTRLRSEWASGNTVEKFFDYVPKGIREVKSK